jgi:hypothetical protein
LSFSQLCDRFAISYVASTLNALTIRPSQLSLMDWSRNSAISSVLEVMRLLANWISPGSTQAERRKGEGKDIEWVSERGERVERRRRE